MVVYPPTGAVVDAIQVMIKASPNQSRQPMPVGRQVSSRMPVAPHGCAYRSAEV